MKNRTIELTLIFILLIGISIYACMRSWTQDESLYILIPKLMKEGLWPYRDISYPQMPLYPLLLRVWQCVAGTNLIGNRMLSVVSIWVLIGLLYVRYGLWVPLLFLSNPLIWDYFVLVKPYAITTLFLYLAVDFAQRKMPLRSGLNFGAAIMIRHLYLFVAVIPLFFFHKATLFKKMTPRFLIGMLAVCSMALIAYTMAPEGFLFNVYWFHQLKNPIYSRSNFTPVVMQWFHTFGSINQVWIVVLGVLSLYKVRCNRNDDATPWLGVFLLMVAPTVILRPYYDEYLIAALPFLFIFIIQTFKGGKEYKLYKYGHAPLLLIAIGLGTLACWTQLQNIIHTRQNNMESMNDIHQVHKVGVAIANLTKSEDVILSFWSGYALEANRNLPRGLETGINVIEMAHSLDPDRGRRNHVMPIIDVVSLVKEKKIKLIVIGLGTPKDFEPLVVQYYKLVQEIGGAKIYML